MEDSNSVYTLQEIKLNISKAIAMQMLNTDRELWDILSEAQGRLFEEFGIED